MSAVMKNSAIAAKISCMRSKMLTYDDYRQMSELESVAQAASYLKSSTVYSSALMNSDERTIHRETLELLLKSALLDDFEKLYSFADGSLRGFMDKMLIFYEVEAICRGAHSIFTKNYAGENLGRFLKRHIDVDLELLSKASSLGEFAQSLSGTQYHKAFSSLEKSRGSLSVFDIETALGIFCYTSIMKYISGISRQEKKPAAAFYGALVDILNLRTLYRLKCSFKLESEYIYSSIIPYNYKLKKDMIIEIANAPDEASLKLLISRAPYGELFENGLNEHGVMQYIYNMSKRLMRLYPYNYVCISGYFKMKETEIKNIFSVAEGIRYSLEPEKIMSYVVV